MSAPINTALDFWKHVDQSGSCWTWNAAKLHNGYGQFKINGRNWRAHRLAWSLTNGPIPEGMQVNHHCDNPACVNPGHLYIGDQKQNRLDAVVRGRTATGNRNGTHTHPETRAYGERHGRHKLNDLQRAEIRQAYTAGGVSLAELGRQYSVTKQCTWAVVGHRKSNQSLGG